MIECSLKTVTIGTNMQSTYTNPVINLSNIASFSKQTYPFNTLIEWAYSNNGKLWNIDYKRLLDYKNSI